MHDVFYHFIKQSSENVTQQGNQSNTCSNCFIKQFEKDPTSLQRQQVNSAASLSTTLCLFAGKLWGRGGCVFENDSTEHQRNGDCGLMWKRDYQQGTWKIPFSAALHLTKRSRLTLFAKQKQYIPGCGHSSLWPFVGDPFLCFRRYELNVI